MKPLFITNVALLKKQTKKHITELKASIEKEQCATFALAKQCASLYELQNVVKRDKSSSYATLLKQYEDDLCYLSVCAADKEVELTPSEWRHFFKGIPTPELC